MDFHTFVLSLGSSALMHLGELERPGAGAAQTDLPMAKHTIDILAIGDGYPGDRVGEIPGQVFHGRHLAEWSRVYRTGLIAQPDGSDDPEGQQKNRRVEVVINTCG